MPMALCLLVLAMLVAAGPVLGQQGFVGLNQGADLILNSGETRQVLVNGVDILADLADLRAQVKAQAAIITNLNGKLSSLNNTVSTQAAIITSLNSTVSAQAATLGRLTGRTATRSPSVVGNLVGCTNVSAPATQGANLVSGLFHDEFCDDTWAQTIGGTWNASRTYMTSLVLDALVRVNGSVDLSFNRLTLVNFGTLTFVGGDIDVRNNTASGLTQVSLGHLGHVGGTVYLLDTVFTIRNHALASTGPISWTGKQLIDFGAGGVTTIDAPNVLLGADTVDIGGVTTVTGSLTILTAVHLDFGALVTVSGYFTVFNEGLSLTNGDS